MTIQHAALLTQNNSEGLISDMNNPRLYYFTLYLRESLITLSIHLKGVRIGETSNRFNLDKTASIAHIKQLISNQSEHPVTMQHFLWNKQCQITALNLLTLDIIGTKPVAMIVHGKGNKIFQHSTLFGMKKMSASTHNLPL